MTGLSSAFIPFERKIRKSVRRIAQATYAVRSDLAKETVEALFGPPGEQGATLPDDGFASFLERVLAIEVVWGARAPATVGGRPQLAAITLDARATVLDGLSAGADKLSDESPSDASSALRANAFFWGRMDASTTIVGLLVDADRARALAGTAKPPWHLLAQALEKPDRAWLTDERIPDDWALGICSSRI